MNIHSAVFHFLDTNGDGTGTKNAIGNYASAAEEFYVQVPAGQTHPWHIHRMLIQIVDAQAFDPGEYGGMAELTNGILVQTRDESDVLAVDMADNLPIKTNEDWARLCFDTSYENYGGGGSHKILNVRWTFSKAGEPLELRAGERLTVKLNDDFSGLLGHYFMIQGMIH